MWRSGGVSLAAISNSPRIDEPGELSTVAASNQVRRWPRLVGLAVLVLLLLTGVVAALGWLGEEASVTLVNQEGSPIVVNACVEGALDIDAGGRATILVPSNSESRCGVYNSRSYLGCLVLRQKVHNGDIRRLPKDFRPGVTEAQCLGG